MDDVNSVYPLVKSMAEIAYLIGVPVLGTVGGVIALWRSAIANKNLRQERYRIGAELLCSEKSYVGRTSGATVLAKLSADYPEEFDFNVAKTFEAILQYPPCYGKGAQHEGRVDYHSSDTVIVIGALNSRNKKYREMHRVELPGFSPFIVTGEGKVKPNPQHPDYALSKKSKKELSMYHKLYPSPSP